MKEAGKIYVTKDYDMFRIMESNRPVDSSRKKKIKKSIEEIGYMCGAPIIVNDEYYIIDGQCRYIVCKELGLPIYFTIQRCAGIKECIAMNISATSWKMIDYIRSYAARGNVHYQTALEEFEKHPAIKQSVILSICADRSDMVESRIVNGGRFTVRKIDEANRVLDFLDRIMPTLKKLDGDVTRMCYAAAFAYRYSSADNDRLERVIGDMVLTSKVDGTGVSTMMHALKMLELAYNSRLRRENKIRLCVEYEDYMNGRYEWYEKKWGARKK